jgi:hypothetical protein
LVKEGPEHFGVCNNLFSGYCSDYLGGEQGDEAEATKFLCKYREQDTARLEIILMQAEGGDKMRRLRKGQSTLEYVIILSAVIGAIIVVANTVMKPKLESSYGTLGTKMETKIGEVDF